MKPAVDPDLVCAAHCNSPASGSLLITIFRNHNVQAAVADTAPHLRTPKPSEGGVAGNVGLAAVAHDPHIGDLVGCINVEQGSVHDGSTQVQSIAGIVVQLAVQSLNLARLIEAHLQKARASNYNACKSDTLLMLEQPVQSGACGGGNGVAIGRGQRLIPGMISIALAAECHLRRREQRVVHCTDNSQT